ncbi:hypothetical protein GCK72_003953 [Caenorhabditis remanei]|uniref:DUF7809 domain-containing protein n=1 Tax=Caenorhabditis remanei TaxID=31234 RepID=A0A6A5H9W1_CAERE|nr:hypothetical protein GCK72_003953 [Caenorhabditis remanei]KAF1764007.1 hypothetical protein GCK72_003953 [Caenorhabditis remanei]
MSKFLKSSESVLSAECVLISTFDYILEELRTEEMTKVDAATSYVEDNGVETIEKMLKLSNNRLRMYGTARELAENVKMYRNVSGSHQFSEMHGYRLYPYHTTPIVYLSMKNAEYIWKIDVFVILQNMFFDIYPLDKPQVLRTIVAIFLRSQELKIVEKSRFLAFDQQIFGKIEQKMREMMEKWAESEINVDIGLLMEFSSLDLPELREKFKNLVPIEWKQSDSNFFHNILRRFCNFAENETVAIIRLYINTKRVVECLQMILDQNSEIFLENSVKTPVTVRLFEDGDQKFVMKSELFDAINKKNTNDRIIDFCDGEFTISTMDWGEVEEKYGEKIGSVEFIRTPILRAKHKAIPIPQPTGDGFCIPAVDALFDFIKTVIFVVKPYQKFKNPYLHDLTPGYAITDGAFIPDFKTPYFVKLDKLRELKGLLHIMSSVLLGIPAKEVRNAKSDGFTVQNLKNELKHLSLTETFTEIENYAEVVYKHVDRVKKEQFLRTCDLFDAIEHCQRICIINRVPRLKKFLHNQKGCARVPGLKCDECTKIQKIQKIQKTSDAEIPLKTAKTPEYSKNPTIACEKCTESSQIVLKIKNELKINQNLMSEMRKNREDADEQHKKVLEERKKEIGNLQKKIDTQTKWKTENLELKKRISEISSQKNEEIS